MIEVPVLIQGSNSFLFRLYQIAVNDAKGINGEADLYEALERLLVIYHWI